ncbi:hypothetical protein CWO91_32385 [Bradyrhizobium genosp. SA-3]|nr:hypothetical protein CWO91_32385 [Bradyrhizobium genosp. SA-3]
MSKSGPLFPKCRTPITPSRHFADGRIADKTLITLAAAHSYGFLFGARQMPATIPPIEKKQIVA